MSEKKDENSFSEYLIILIVMIVIICLLFIIIPPIFFIFAVKESFYLEAFISLICNIIMIIFTVKGLRHHKIISFKFLLLCIIYFITLIFISFNSGSEICALIANSLNIILEDDTFSAGGVRFFYVIGSFVDLFLISTIIYLIIDCINFIIQKINMEKNKEKKNLLIYKLTNIVKHKQVIVAKINQLLQEYKRINSFITLFQMCSYDFKADNKLSEEIKYMVFNNKFKQYKKNIVNEELNFDYINMMYEKLNEEIKTIKDDINIINGCISKEYFHVLSQKYESYN